MPETMHRLKALTEELPSPDLLVRLVDDLPDALIVVNHDGRIVLFNRQAELLFGYHRSEMIGELVDLLVPDAVREAHALHREGFISEPRNRPMGIGLKLAGRHKEGREFPVEINLSPLQTADGLFVSAVARKVKA